MSEQQPTVGKSWKRESALGLILWLLVMITWIAVTNTGAGVRLIEAMIAPVLAFTAAAFGLHVWQGVEINKSASAGKHGAPSLPPTTGVQSNANSTVSGAGSTGHPFRPDVDQDSN